MKNIAFLASVTILLIGACTYTSDNPQSGHESNLPDVETVQQPGDSEQADSQTLEECMLDIMVQQGYSQQGDAAAMELDTHRNPVIRAMLLLGALDSAAIEDHASLVTTFSKGADRNIIIESVQAKEGRALSRLTRGLTEVREKHSHYLDPVAWRLIYSPKCVVILWVPLNSRDVGLTELCEQLTTACAVHELTEGHD